MEVYITRQVFQETRRLRVTRQEFGVEGMDTARCVDTYLLADGRTIVHEFTPRAESFLLRPAVPPRGR